MVRRAQQAFFVVGLVALLAAAVRHDQYEGLTFWRVGIAGMLTSIALGLAFAKKS